MYHAAGCNAPFPWQETPSPTKPKASTGVADKPPSPTQLSTIHDRPDITTMQEESPSSMIAPLTKQAAEPGGSVATAAAESIDDDSSSSDDESGPGDGSEKTRFYRGGLGYLGDFKHPPLIKRSRATTQNPTRPTPRPRCAPGLLGRFFWLIPKK